MDTCIFLQKNILSPNQHNSLLAYRRFCVFIMILFWLFTIVTPVGVYGMESRESEQFWVKTTMTSLTIDWNARTIADDPVLMLRVFQQNDSDILWQGQIKGMQLDQLVRFKVDGLNPKPWAPSTPELYQLEFALYDGTMLLEETTYRIGFRSFETEGGRFYLNGKPLFLRGIAINPPGRGIPDDVETSREFARDYIRFMKSLHVNIIRIPDNPTWYEVCDEEGMMVFGGNYSVAIAGARIPEVYDDGVTWFKEEKFAPFVHHPSLMIRALTNEVPFRGDIALQWVDFLSYAYKELKEWDPTRLYIGNAGYGYGQSGDICDLHRYWGWYYASPYTYLHIRDYDSIVFPDKVQPLTFTECVGNYTGPDGRYNLTPNHKNPVSQKKWTGHAPAFQQHLLADEHQSWVFKEATELMRRLRRINTESAGIFPFTIMFRNWHTVQTFTDMDPKPVCWQARRSFQPVLLSWENWKPQVYAGGTIHPVAHIVNDDDNFSDLHHNLLVVHILDKALSKMYSDTMAIPDIPYYDIYSHPLNITLPETLFSGNYYLEGIVISNGKEVSRNREQLLIASKTFIGIAKSKEVLLYDPRQTTNNALSKIGMTASPFDDIARLGQATALIIGEDAADETIYGASEDIRRFMEQGGRVLVMRQDSVHQRNLQNILPVPVYFPTMDIDNPAYPPPIRPSANSFNINPERSDHPVFSGLNRSKLRMWSDYSAWDETQNGMPQIYPVTNGFVLENKEDIATTAVLANYSVGLEGIALAEFFVGDGSVLLSGFDLVNRSDLDPVADLLLKNMVEYVLFDDDHEVHPLISAPIRWGEYETEKGLLTGIYSGFMLNSKPALYDSYEHLPILLLPDGHMYGERGGGWNNRAGLQYVPYGRRMFGPYIHRGFAGTPTIQEPSTDTGKAYFWCRVPEHTGIMQNLVWNPADVALTFKVSVNDSANVMFTIQPGEYKHVEVPLVYTPNPIKFELEGDRRLVVLETSFIQ